MFFSSKNYLNSLQFFVKCEGSDRLLSSDLIVLANIRLSLMKSKYLTVSGLVLKFALFCLLACFNTMTEIPCLENAKLFF